MMKLVSPNFFQREEVRMKLKIQGFTINNFLKTCSQNEGNLTCQALITLNQRNNKINCSWSWPKRKHSKAKTFVGYTNALLTECVCKQ